MNSDPAITVSIWVGKNDHRRRGSSVGQLNNAINHLLQRPQDKTVVVLGSFQVGICHKLGCLPK